MFSSPCEICLYKCTQFYKCLVWGGYGIFSDPDGDRRHFNRDVYGIWFTTFFIILTTAFFLLSIIYFFRHSLWTLFFSWTLVQLVIPSVIPPKCFPPLPPPLSKESLFTLNHETHIDPEASSSHAKKIIKNFINYFLKTKAKM